jgi:hypothetical protein
MTPSDESIGSSHILPLRHMSGSFCSPPNGASSNRSRLMYGVSSSTCPWAYSVMTIPAKPWWMSGGVPAA